MSVLLRKNGGTLIGVLLILLQLERVMGGDGSVESCQVVDMSKPISDPCPPCPKSDWFEYVLAQRMKESDRVDGGDSVKTQTSCFNNYPLGTSLQHTHAVAITRGERKAPVLDMQLVRIGFITPRQPFFRYTSTNYKETDVEKFCSPSGTKWIDYSCPYECYKSPTDGDDSSQAPPPDETKKFERNFDIADVKQYYLMKGNQDNGTAPEEDEDLPEGSQVDLHLVEWPGRTTLKQMENLEKKLERQCMTDYAELVDKPKHCRVTESRKFQILHFQRASSKLLHYPCNKQEGTQITAFGLISVSNREEQNERDEPTNGVFLAYDKSSIYTTYTEPLMVLEEILLEMAKPDTGAHHSSGTFGLCLVKEQECAYTVNTAAPGDTSHNEELCFNRQKFFQETMRVTFDKKRPECRSGEKHPQQNCQRCMNQLLPSEDLRAVLDFTFVEGRLILGMRCGVLVVDGLIYNRLDIYTSSLQTERGLQKNAFYPVSKIDSNHCCKKDRKGCSKTIIAAYPTTGKKFSTKIKLLYVSFDLGITFTIKPLVQEQSALNVMWGMYKYYSNTILYQRLLETPEHEDLYDEDGKDIFPGFDDLRASPDWEALTLEEKEDRFMFGEIRDDFKDVESGKAELEKLLRLRFDGVLRKFTRIRKRNESLNTNMAPKWLSEEIWKIRRSAGWTQDTGWTDSNCESIPECRAKFVNDPIVEYLLNQSKVLVKSPRRDTHELFCLDIAALIVLNEEDSVLIICEMAFGEFPELEDDAKFEPGAGEMPCSSHQLDFLDPDNWNSLDGCINSHDKTSYKSNICVDPIKYYSVYFINVKDKLPMAIYDEKKKSEQLFTCKPVYVDMDWMGCKKLQVDPEFVRVPHSIAILIKNCQGILYYSPNGGRTMYNTEFYAHHSEFPDLSKTFRHKDCYNSNQTGNTPSPGDGGNTDGGPPSPSEKKPVPEHQRQKMYRLKSLDNPPQIALSHFGNVVLMTMRDKYAYGLLGVNSPFRMIVGEIFPNSNSSILNRVKSNDFAFPGFTLDGRPFFGIALKLIYGHNPLFACKLYNQKYAIRLVHMEMYLYRDIAHYYAENTDLLKSAKEKAEGIEMCQTLGFSINQNEMSLDVGESSTMEIKSYDQRPNIPLAILSSREKSLLINVELVDQEDKDEEKSHLLHRWELHIQAIKNTKSRRMALIESFFGVENSNLLGHYSQVNLANELGMRCHAQSAATVGVHVECRDKKMVAHEDEHRPQCAKGTFSKHVYTYTLKLGQYNPHLVAYWRELDMAENTTLFKLDKKTGNLQITYDYLRFGCPLEPYKDDAYIPDLRIVSADQKFNSSVGERYNGSFILIELLGAKGFTFSRKFRDINCHFTPINVSAYLEDWVHRRRLFKGISTNLVAPYKEAEAIRNAQTIQDLKDLQYGSQIFSQYAADHPTNIINRVTYRDCKKWRDELLESELEVESPLLEDEDNPIPEETKRYLLDEQPMPILKRDGKNAIIWSKNIRPIYIFLAVALDPTESICEYYTVFAVSIPNVGDAEGLITFLIFLLLTLLWIAIFLCGYALRKSRIRKHAITLERKRRLEEAAWKIVYRYEKLLQEHENYGLEEEIKEFRQKEAEKMRLREVRRRLQQKVEFRKRLAELESQKLQKRGITPKTTSGTKSAASRKSKRN